MKSDAALRRDLERDVWCVLGLIFDNFSVEQTKRAMKSVVRQGSKIAVCTPNLNFVAMARSDAEFRDSVLGSDMSLLDGMPILWVSKLLGYPLPERVPGSGLIEQLHREKDNRFTVFLFGGAEGIAEKAYKKINEHSAGLVAVGHHDPGYVAVEEMGSRTIIDDINKYTPDFLLLALGAKKAQRWIDLNKGQLNARIIVHVGATIGFLAGMIKRAPRAIQRIGLEWLWRIFEEPTLWRRYARDGIVVGQLVFTRILPYGLWLRTIGPKPFLDSHLDVGTNSTDDCLNIRLTGAGSRQTLDSFRETSMRAACANKDVLIDVSMLEYIDAAFLAHLIVLRKHILLAGKTLSLKGVSPHVKQIIRYNCAEYLLI